MSLFHDLRLAARPFVSRSMRGPRARRAGVLSAVLAVVTVVAGLWIALGNGRLEHGMRRSLGLEVSMHQREIDEFMVLCHDDVACRRIDHDRAVSGEAYAMYLEGLTLTQSAVGSFDPTWDDEHTALYDRARALLERQPAARAPGRRRGFDWAAPELRARLEVIVAAELRPAVVRYASPLSVRTAFALVGLLALGMLVVLGTVVGPVLTGIAVAQESHENTLQPVAGTALTPRGIALGLVAGAYAPVGIAALPQAVLAVIIAPLVGNALPLLGFFALLVPCVWALATLSVVVGLYAGKRRGPGAVGISLLAAFGTWAFAGIPLGFEALGRAEAAVMTLLPSGGLVLAARETFLGEVPMRAVLHIAVPWRLLAAAITAVVVGALALLAAERRVPGRVVAPLHRIEALLGSAVLSAITLLALSQERSSPAALTSLAVMIMPMQILLMGRVPTGDAPGAPAPVRVPALLREFATFAGVHFALAVLIVGPAFVVDVVPGLLHIGWALGVAALVSLRVVAMPAKLPATVWAGFCFVVAMVTFGTGVAHSVEGGHVPWFVSSTVSPWLGAVQIALTLAIPYLLVRALCRPARKLA